MYVDFRVMLVLANQTCSGIRRCSDRSRQRVGTTYALTSYANVLTCYEAALLGSRQLGRVH
jgi:hypothetical protein